jgi:hypothetical protein
MAETDVEAFAGKNMSRGAAPMAVMAAMAAMSFSRSITI